MTVPRASAQKTDMQRLVVHVGTRQADAVPQANQPLTPFQSQNVGTLLTWDMMSYQQPQRVERGYPRPQLERTRWTSLSGTWEFALDPEAHWLRPEDVTWYRAINVPFSAETAASSYADEPTVRSSFGARRIHRAGLRRPLRSERSSEGAAGSTTSKVSPWPR